MRRVYQPLLTAGTLLLALTVLLSGTVDAGANGGRILSTNQDVINALDSKIDLSSAKEVFTFVFGKLRNEVIVYPTENYYYFEFFAQGKLFKGNFGLFVDNRDRGELNFAYEEVPGDDEIREGFFNEATLSPKDGIHIHKLSAFRYAVSFHNKTVIFNLNQIEQKLPARIRLMRDEVFVGHSFDESGVKFFLIFNRKFNHLFWLLNDEGGMPETLTVLDTGILIGKRTAFAFYDDRDNARRILIGVSKEAVERNSWYDGPFDQLPDNYIASGQVEVREYMQAAYPYAKGKIDKFGIWLVNPENRIAITSYLEYSRYSQLKEVVDGARKARKVTSRFYCEITGM